MRILWDTIQSSNSLPNVLQFPCLPSSLSFSSFIEPSSLSFLSKALSWWWRFSFHGLFSSGWCLLSPLFLYLSLQLHGWKSPLKDLIETQISNLHRSFSNKLPSPLVLLRCYLILRRLRWSSLLLFWRLWRCLLRPHALESPFIICTPLVMLIHCEVQLKIEAKELDRICVSFRQEPYQVGWGA